MWRLLRLIGAWVLVRAVAASVLSDVSAIALTATATWLLLRAAQHPELLALSLGIAVVRATAMVRGLARYGERLAGHDGALRALATVRRHAYTALAGRTPAELAATGSADALGTVVHDVDSVQDLVVRCIVPITSAAVVGTVAVAVTTAFLPAAGLALAVGLLLVLGPVPVLAARLSARSDRLIAAERGRLTASVVDLVHGAAELAVTGAGETALTEVDRTGQRLAARERLAPAHGATAVVGIIAGLTAVAVLLLGIAAGLDALAVPVLVLLVLATFESCVPLPAAARQFARIRGAADRLHTLHADEIHDAGFAAPESHDIRCRGLTVRYGDGPPAIADLDLDLPAGRRLAVVGASGSGKSTLLAALIRFVPTDSGRITIGGADLGSWAEKDLRRTVSGMLADAHVFHDTIEANLRIAEPDADHDALVDAARRARLLDWIEDLPDGWRTVVGENAALLSGGQRQRLLLARALLADPPVLLLDEPTEGLDPETADRVLADVLAERANQTTVLVTHRIAELDSADEVILLDAGRIAQRGTHAQLIGVDGPYRDLWRCRSLG